MPQKVYALSLFLFLLAGCGRGEVVMPATPTTYIHPDRATATAEVLRATEVAAAVPPAADAPAQPVGDPARGQTLFTTFQAEANFACNTCHLVDSEAQLIGPGLKGVGQRAGQRVAGTNAVEYLHDSIINPSAFVVPNYPDNLMPHVYGNIFTEEQINDLIAYLMSL